LNSAGEARPLLEEALRIHRLHGGGERLDTASTLDNLASLLADQGETDEAVRSESGSNLRESCPNLLESSRSFYGGVNADIGVCGDGKHSRQPGVAPGRSGRDRRGGALSLTRT
jgi:hypothetical protein